jgi:hypothetical protein
MIFPYQPVIVAAPDGDFIELLRPEIEISIVGRSGTATLVGLVDTGSENTIFPKSIADDLERSNKTSKRGGTVPFCSADCAKSGQSPDVLLERT